MEKMIGTNVFNFGFFLANRTEVNDLVSGAKLHGGATQFDNGVFSNIEGDDFIKVNDTNNSISIFVPSTINVDEKIDNSKQVKQVMQLLKLRYPLENLKFYMSQGSWYSDDLKKVVVEDITIVTLDTKIVTELDIHYFEMLANYVKKELNQEGVSVMINDSLAII